jgi:hypothetical protein
MHTVGAIEMVLDNETNLTKLFQASEYKQHGKLQDRWWIKYLDVIGIETVEQLKAFCKRQEPREWRGYLFSLLTLPESSLRMYQLLPSSAQEKLSIPALVFQQSLLVMWLDYLVPGDKPFNPRLNEGLAKTMEPRAKYSKAVLDLAVHIHQRYPELRNDDTPADLWLNWEMQQFHEGLVGSGLITGRPEQSPSLSKYVNEARKGLQLMDDPEAIRFTPGKFTCGAGEAIVSYATKLAGEDQEFRYSRTWTGFKAAYRAWLRAVRRGDFSQLAFEDGKILPGGRNAKRTPNKVSKAFVTKPLQKKV